MCTLSSNNTYVDNKSICDGFGCLSEATSSIEEEVDGIGMIKLDLCDDCIIKFREE